MKHRIKPGIILLCLLALLFSSCTSEQTPVPIGSEIWEEMPKLTYGVMEYDKLKVLPWNSGRCEATSANAMAETSIGYYMVPGAEILHYADKADLSNWVPVCNLPTCSHSQGSTTCNAKVAQGSFVIQNDRIYYGAYAPWFSDEYAANPEDVLLSMAADGTDKKLEYRIARDSSLSPSSIGSYISSRYWVYNEVLLDSSGCYQEKTHLLTADGEVTTITTDFGTEHPGNTLLSPGTTALLYGDPAIVRGYPDLAWPGTKCLQFRDSELQEVNLSGISANGGYLSGNIIRIFRENDGYYDINLETREEVKLAEAQLKNSKAYIMLPNCILESTLANMENRSAEPVHQLLLFDGESWRDIQLPSKLVNANEQHFLRVVAVTSDAILLRMVDYLDYSSSGIADYYLVDLTAEELVMEFMAQIDEF